MDADEASGLVGSTALLEFREIDPVQSVVAQPPTRLDVRDAIDDVWMSQVRGDPELLNLRAWSYFIPEEDEDVIVAEEVRWIPALGITEEGETVQLSGPPPESPIRSPARSTIPRSRRWPLSLTTKARG